MLPHARQVDKSQVNYFFPLRNLWLVFLHHREYAAFFTAPFTCCCEIQVTCCCIGPAQLRQSLKKVPFKKTSHPAANRIQQERGRSFHRAQFQYTLDGRQEYERILVH